MAYIEGYTYDIFISYSHIDNEKLYGQTIGWIEEFYNDLTVALWQSIGTRDIKIWWDERRLNGGTFFDDAIADAINSSAILLCLNSPAYLKSQYCKKELELFYNNAQKQPFGLKVGSQTRILNALLNNIPYKSWPQELNGTSGFRFHDAANNESRGHRLDTKSSQFGAGLQVLTDAFVELIEEFSKVTGETGNNGVAQANKFTIFFANVSDTLKNIKTQTIKKLEKEDYKIISKVPPPYDKSEHEKVVREKIAEADLTVHLLDQYPGSEIEGEDILGYAQKQAELSLSSDKPQLIWIPGELNIDVIEEDDYKAFMQSLKQSPKKNIEYIIGTKSELPQQIKDFAEQIKVKNKRQTSGTKVSVLLDTHYNDQLYALEISKSLLENDIQPYINPQSDDPLENIKVLEDRISQVKSLIFFYGKVAGDWVSERMKAARKFIVTNDYPIDVFYVYLLPPKKDPHERSLEQRFIKVNVLNNSDMPQLDTLTLQQLLQNIKAYHEQC